MTDVLDGIPIIDCDAHFTEPPDLWTSRVPAEWQDRVPVQRTIDGKTAWYVDGEVWASTGGNTIRRGKEKILGSHIIQPFDDIDPGAWSVVQRLEILDSMGVYAQVIYPNAVGFASNHIFAIEDLEQRTVILKTYNDFFMDLQDESGGRLLPQPVLPVWDMDLTVSEMERLIKRGARGFTLSDKPEMIGLPELIDDYFSPMWELFNESGAVANFHIGSGARREEQEAMRNQNIDKSGPAPGAPLQTFWSSFGRQRRLAIHATQMYMSNVRIIINLCMSDLFDRYPKLKIVSAESGIGWIPFIFEAIEYQIDEMVTDVDEVSLQLRRPSDYFRDHIWVMFWFEQIGPAKLLNDIGVNNVLVETDIPHPTCLYPGAREHFAKVLADVDPQVRRRVLCDNAAELYGIDVPASI
jgi:predicted TIM-barrel fold metal-dependent hydrolase